MVVWLFQIVRTIYIIYIYLLSTECIPGNISKPTISSQLATADKYMYSFSISISTTYVCDPDQRSHYREIPYLPLFFDHTPTLDICLTVFFVVFFVVFFDRLLIVFDDTHSQTIVSPSPTNRNRFAAVPGTALLAHMYMHAENSHAG